MSPKNLKIIGIDTSCDDTSCALLEFKGKKLQVLSNVISSQVKLHAPYGGVFPSLAKREHQKNLSLVFKKALKGFNLSDIDLIGATSGPGLEPCLWEGINFALEKAKRHKKPLVFVNHMEAHILANYINKDIDSIKLPAVCLIVSGGHTQLVLMKKIGSYSLIGETVDDAAGECLDKVARILGLGYPGGPVISREAEKFSGKRTIFLPRPMIHQKNYDFSFSGLKTAVLYHYKKQPPRKRKSLTYIREMCSEVQQAVIDVLLAKTYRAVKEFKVGSVILGGGVAANKELRRQLEEKVSKESEYYKPDLAFCTDNGAMVAAAAYFNRQKKPLQAKADSNLGI